MFWPFTSSCPVDEPSRKWLNAQLHWLSREFEDESPITNDLILPTPECFPDPYDGSPESVRRLFERVCPSMRVEPDQVRLEVMNAGAGPELINSAGDLMPTAAGLYEEGEGDPMLAAKFVVHLDRSQFERPMDLVGTIAHELAHVRLLGESRIDPDRYDNELLTDLTATWCGFGIFLANSPRGDWKAISGTWPGTDLRRPEYMTAPMYGYALARIAEMRFEEQPRWAKHLRWDARSLMKQAMRWLSKRAKS